MPGNTETGKLRAGNAPWIQAALVIVIAGRKATRSAEKKLIEITHPAKTDAPAAAGAESI
jgi:hypothetical protein